MPMGRGRYDREAEELMAKLPQARLVVVGVVADLPNESGFSTVGEARYALAMPGILRMMADQIEKSMKMGDA